MQRKARPLWELTSGQRHRYALALLALGASTAFAFVPAQIVAAMIDGVLKPATLTMPRITQTVLAVLGGRDFVTTHLWIPTLVIALAAALAGAFGYLRGRLSAVASETIIRRLRNRLYNHLQHVPVSYHDVSPTGDLVQRCTSDVDTVRAFFQSQVIEIVDASVRLVIALPILFAFDVRMALVAIAVLPVIVGFAKFFFGRVQGTFKKTDEAEGAMSARMQENLTGIRVVRAFARQEFERDKFRERNETHRALNYKLYKIFAIYWASSDFLCFTQIATVVIYGAVRVMNGQMNMGTYVAFMTFTGMYLWPVRHMGRVLTELGKTLVALGRINEVLATPVETAPASPTQLPQRVTGRIEFNNVTFAHKETPVLRGISFAVEPGQTVALLGASGSGKSTIIHLLLRFYDWQSGTITIDGVDIASVDRKAVRSLFGVVMQEPFLYGKTVRDNIRIGRFDANEADVTSVASTAAIHESILTFEKQYDTLVGERGVTLSGGQRQRVAIARALLREAPILILDDALSAVDTHTEADIVGSLRNLRGKQTTLIIAHRLSTLMHADRIIVLERGQITQSGTHDELVNEPGLYRNLWHIQSELEDDLRQELGSDVAEPLSVRS